MDIIVAPHHEHHVDLRNRLFLGGGISGCPDWQAIMIDLIRKGLEAAGFDHKWIMFNPRREHFDINDSSQSLFQIQWEDAKLRTSDIILFWFPEETMCPITLLELGKYGCMNMAWNKTILVGCHPNYARKFDVEIQLALSDDSSIQVVDTLEKLAQQVVDAIVSGDY